MFTPPRTFEKDKFAVVALVGSVDVVGEADPEDRYGHGVVIQDPVPPHTPEPATLHHKAKLCVYLKSDLFIFALSERLLALRRRAIADS